MIKRVVNLLKQQMQECYMLSIASMSNQLDSKPIVNANLCLVEPANPGKPIDINDWATMRLKTGIEEGQDYVLVQQAPEGAKYLPVIRLDIIESKEFKEQPVPFKRLFEYSGSVDKSPIRVICKDSKNDVEKTILVSRHLPLQRFLGKVCPFKRENTYFIQKINKVINTVTLSNNIQLSFSSLQKAGVEDLTKIICDQKSEMFSKNSTSNDIPKQVEICISDALKATYNLLYDKTLNQPNEPTNIKLLELSITCQQLEEKLSNSMHN
jgi:hypothetical protein